MKTEYLSIAVDLETAENLGGVISLRIKKIASRMATELSFKRCEEIEDLCWQLNKIQEVIDKLKATEEEAK